MRHAAGAIDPIERRIDELITQLPPLTDNDRRQAVAILSSVSPHNRSAA